MHARRTTTATLAALAAAVALTAPAPTARAAGTTIPDVDGNGRPDVVVTYSDHVVVEYNAPRVDLILDDGTRRTYTFGDLGLDAMGMTGFGWTATIADLNADGYADVVTSGELELVEDSATYRVYVLWGSSTGLRSSGNLTIDEPADVSSRAGFEVFGASLAVLDGPTLVVGAPYADVRTRPDAGVIVTYPVADGKVGAPRVWTQDSPGIPGAAEAEDYFGSELVASGDRLVVSSPNEAVGAARGAGMVALLRWDGHGLSGVGVHQGSRDVPGRPERADHFGAALDVSGDRVLVGVPGEGIGTKRRAGMAQVLRYSPSGFAVGPDIQQGLPGIPGTNETGDRFGWAVALFRPCAGTDGLAYAVGTPDEATGRGRHGSLTLVAGDATPCLRNRLLTPGAGLSASPALDDAGIVTTVPRATAPDRLGVGHPGSRWMDLVDAPWSTSSATFEGLSDGRYPGAIATSNT